MSLVKLDIHDSVLEDIEKIAIRNNLKRNELIREVLQEFCRLNSSPNLPKSTVFETIEIFELIQKEKLLDT